MKFNEDTIISHCVPLPSLHAVFYWLSLSRQLKVPSVCFYIISLDSFGIAILDFLDFCQAATDLSWRLMRRSFCAPDIIVANMIGLKPAHLTWQELDGSPPSVNGPIRLSIYLLHLAFGFGECTSSPSGLQAWPDWGIECDKHFKKNTSKR